MDVRQPNHVHPHQEHNHPEHQHTPQTPPEAPKKPWYKQWYGIIALILIWPIFLVWYAWAKSNWSKIAKIGATVAGVFAAFVYVVAAASPAPTTPAPKVATTVTQPASTPKPAPKPVAAPQPAKPLTMTDKLWQAVDAGLKSRKDITVSYDTSDPSDRVAFIEHTNAQPFDSQSFIRQSFAILVLFGQQAFKIDGVDSVNVQNKTNFTDQYGNTKLDTGVVIDMHKADFEKFNWKNLEGTPVRAQIEASSDVFTINPGLLPYTDQQLELTLSYP